MKLLILLLGLSAGALIGHEYATFEPQAENREIAAHQEGFREGLTVAWNGEWREVGVPPKKISVYRMTKIEYRMRKERK